MKRLFSSCIALALSYGLGMCAFAADPSDVDSAFLQQAAYASLFEMEVSKLAQQKASADEVKGYAELMLTDHGKMDAALKNLADAKGLALPTALDGDKQVVMDRLRQENAASFDDTYVNDVAIGAHEEAVRLFTQAATQSDDAGVKAFAAATLATLQSHLNRAQHLKKTLSGELKRSTPPVPQSIKPSKEQGQQPSKEPDPGSPEKAAESQ